MPCPYEGIALDGAYLDGANLYSANLYSANLYGAYLEDVKWDDLTQLKRAKNLDTAQNVPEGLQQLWESQNH